MRISRKKRIENNMEELIRADADVMANIGELELEFGDIVWFKHLKHNVEWLDEIVWKLRTAMDNRR